MGGWGSWLMLLGWGGRVGIVWGWWVLRGGVRCGERRGWGRYWVRWRGGWVGGLVIG